MDLIVEGSVLELQDVSDPFLFWPFRVVQNVGGRLRLRGAGLSEDQQAQDSWLFYLDVRLRPVGWALENQLALEPPTGEHDSAAVTRLLEPNPTSSVIKSEYLTYQTQTLISSLKSSELRSLKSAPDWQEALEEARLHGQENPLPLEVFKVSRSSHVSALHAVCVCLCVCVCRVGSEPGCWGGGGFPLSHLSLIYDVKPGKSLMRSFKITESLENCVGTWTDDTRFCPEAAEWATESKQTLVNFEPCTRQIWNEWISNKEEDRSFRRKKTRLK